MKLLKIQISGLKLFDELIEIDFFARQRVNPDKNEMLTRIVKNIYTNNVISFVGINASGKTTCLKIISFVMQLLQNEPINKIVYKEILGEIKSNDKVCIKSFFVLDKNVYMLTTHIGFVDDKYKIIYEMLKYKSIKSIKSKSDLFEFEIEDKKYSIVERDSSESFLLDDLSIIVSLNKTYKNILYMKDSIEWTNVNGIRIYGEFVPELVKLLDPTIEYIECADYEKENKDFEYKIKFLHKNETILASPIELNRYLSSGTIKGLNIFTTSFSVLEKGGYFIVDELENHFNIEIVSYLIKFFMDKDLNNNGATLIFSTHYPELLDKLERNDSIYVTQNKYGITINNFDTILHRNDTKKSDFLKSGYDKITVPSYDSYIALKRKLKTCNFEIQ